MSEILVYLDDRHLGRVDVASRNVDLERDVDVRPVLESVVGGANSTMGPNYIETPEGRFDSVDVAYMDDDEVVGVVTDFLSERGYRYETQATQTPDSIALD